MRHLPPKLMVLGRLRLIGQVSSTSLQSQFSLQKAPSGLCYTPWGSPKPGHRGRLISCWTKQRAETRDKRCDKGSVTWAGTNRSLGWGCRAAMLQQVWAGLCSNNRFCWGTLQCSDFSSGTQARNPAVQRLGMLLLILHPPSAVLWLIPMSTSPEPSAAQHSCTWAPQGHGQHP